jgi:hypothetical protein
LIPRCVGQIVLSDKSLDPKESCHLCTLNLKSIISFSEGINSLGLSNGRLLGVKATGDDKKQTKVSKLAKQEVLMVNIGSTSTGGKVLNVKAV